MDEVVKEGRKYISAKRAARESGYNQDYIGQLVRSNKVEAIRVGRGWFVSENFLKGKSQMVTVGRRIQTPVSQRLASAVISFPRTWSSVTYHDDYDPLFIRPRVKNEHLVEDRKHFERLPSAGVPSLAVDGIRPVQRSTTRKPDIAIIRGHSSQKSSPAYSSIKQQALSKWLFILLVLICAVLIFLAEI